MRDPDGQVLVLPDGRVIREISPQSPSIKILQSQLAKDLVERGWVLPYEWESASRISAPRLPFVSSPSEWSDAHFVDAALTTLAISNRSLIDEVELKDASAYNVLFRGCVPIFCDHTSFQPQDTWDWFAFGQFVRHFILPLAISSLTELRAHKCFVLFRDGIQPAQARKILGAKRFFSRWWPLTLGLDTSSSPTLRKTRKGTEMRKAIYDYCRWNIRERRATPKSSWASYTKDRNHYSDQAQAAKIGKVRDWLERIRPKWVLDMGCNTGEYARLALDLGASVIAVDQDHDVIEGLYQSSKDQKNLYPVISNLTDPTPGRGWRNAESPPLLERLSGLADVVLCLALIHHLIVSESIPAQEVAKLITRLTSRYVMVEFIDPEDPMMKLLIGRHRRDCSDFALAKQKAAFLQYFDVEAVEALPASKRELALLRKRSQA
jgi:SAM-dependent methyltransferase